MTGIQKPVTVCHSVYSADATRLQLTTTESASLSSFK